MTLVAQVMTQEPYASAERASWIVDNGSTHRSQAAIDRLAKHFPNAVMVRIPRPRLMDEPNRDPHTLVGLQAGDCP